MADIATAFKDWSATSSSNQPDNSDSIGPNTLADNLRVIQAVVRSAVGGDGTIASASTADLSTVEANYINVTGTTTITALGTLSAGVIKILKFAGILTFTHNGTSLILPGSANITTAAGDVAIMRSEGSGNWRCLVFMPATGYLSSSDIGVSVQSYDVDTLKADTADVLTAGFAATPYNAGTKSTGTYTPDEANGNFQYAVNGGAHTLAPPTNNCTLIIQYTNNGSAGAITTSGFTKVTGSFTTTNGDDFFCFITKCNGFSHLAIQALQ